MTIESAYRQDQLKPRLIQRWERVACDADEPELATTQLVYELLVQVRTIKLILTWVMVIIPVGVVALGILIATVSTALASGPTSSWGT